MSISQQQLISEPEKVPTPDKFKRWNSLYPMYLDATRSIKQGRQISKEAAVPNPTFVHLLKGIKQLNITSEIYAEPHKKHPRDQLNPGRVRIQLFNESGNFQVEGYNDVKSLYIALAAAIKEIQSKEFQQKESKKLALDQKQKQKQKSKSSAVRSFQDDPKKKKKKGRH